MSKVDPRAKPVDAALYRYTRTNRIGTMEWAPLDDPGGIGASDVGIFWPSDGSPWDYVKAHEIESLQA